MKYDRIPETVLQVPELRQLIQVLISIYYSESSDSSAGLQVRYTDIKLSEPGTWQVCSRAIFPQFPEC